MSPEEALIRAVEADPAADLPRLVYADWLDENRREPFADFLRTELELAKLPLDSPAAPPLRERLWQAWAAVDAAWLHRFTQPKMLRANPTPFPTGWWHCGLGDVRESHGVYAQYSYDSIPPHPIADSLRSFDYLGEPPPLSTRSATHYAPRHHKRLEQLQIDAGNVPFHLPQTYLNYMRDYRRVGAHRSALACSFLVPDHTEPIRQAVAGAETHIPFYAHNDRNEAELYWDVFSHPAGGHCVIARLDSYFAPEPPDPDDPDPYTGPRAWFVAPSFEAFVYRVWVENEIWFTQHADFVRRHLGKEPPPVTPAIQAYIDHYRTQANGGT